MNAGLRGLQPHASKAISEEVTGDATAIDLTVGVPYYGPPPSVQEALARMISDGEERRVRQSWDIYAPALGNPALRCAIAEHYRETYGLEVDHEREVLVTHGASGALCVAIVAMTEPGDEVLIPDPAYMLYAPLVVALGRAVVRIPTSASDAFALHPTALDRCVGRRSRVVIVNSPANPTGQVIPPGRLMALAAGASDRGLLLLHDEVLDCFTQSAHLPARAIANRPSVAIVNSASKRLGMSGWRVGWLVGDSDLIAQAAKAQTFMSLGVGHAGQVAVAAGLRARNEHRWIAGHAERLVADVNWFSGALAASSAFPCRPLTPAGGLYLFVDVSDAADQFGRASDETAGEAIARALLDRVSVAVVPGTVFGERGADFVRMSIAGGRDVLEQVLERFETGLARRRGHCA